MRLTEIADVIRSKNAGPYLITLDVLFKDRSVYERFKKSQIITRETIAQLYEIAPEDICGVIFFEPADALKITFRRDIVSGGFGDRDIYGAQQHLPLMEFDFEW